MRFMGGPRTREQGEELFAANLTHWERHGFGPLAVQLREATEGSGASGASGAPEAPLLGRVALSLLEDTDEVELGYLLDAPWQGQGYASEAAAALVAWGFEALALPRIVALALPEHAASLRVMRRLGMQPDGTAHHHGFDVVRFVLTRAEWEARRAAARRAGRGL